ncbi:MAG: P-loop NTPase [Armatimonadota bacterium]|nr:P-loop NTPase [Armatimonadota bacterium]
MVRDPSLRERPILLFHPDPTIRDSIKRSLEPFGTTVESVEEIGALMERATLLLPGVIVVQISDESLEAIGLLTSAYPQVRVIGLAQGVELGIVRKAIQAGIRDLLNDPPDGPTVAESVLALLQSEESGNATLRGFLIALVSAKGGVGTTTTALNLAALLASEGKSALLDADTPGFGTAHTMVATRNTPPGTIAALFHQGLPSQAALLKRIAVHHTAGIDTFTLWDSRRDEEVVTEHIAPLLDSLASLYPFLTVDIGRPIHEAQHRILQRADAVLALTTLDVCALRNFRWLWDLLSESGIVSRKLLTVLNRLQKNQEISQREAESVLKRKFDVVLPENPEIQRITDNGEIAVKARADLPWCRKLEALGELIRTKRRELLHAAFR